MRPENRELVGIGDVILAAHPGSGASWVGTLLTHLGIFYLSGEDELLADAQSQRAGGLAEDRERALPGAEATGRPNVGVQAQLEHLPTLRDRDRDHATWREPVRVIKTNLSSLSWTPPCRVLLLVRDGRDAVLSLYHHRVNFSDLDVPLLDFLTGNDGAWLPPPMSWAMASMSWIGSTPKDQIHLLKFETCKADPLEEFRSMLTFMEIERTDAEIETAIAASSYNAMRRQESAAMEEHGAEIGSGRIMRKGQVGEWREVYTEPMLATFKGMPRRALKQLGYPVDEIPG